MNLIDSIKEAIEKKDRAKLPYLEKRFNDELQALIAVGQRNYAQNLLADLRNVRPKIQPSGELVQ